MLKEIKGILPGSFPDSTKRLRRQWSVENRSNPSGTCYIVYCLQLNLNALALLHCAVQKKLDPGYQHE